MLAVADGLDHQGEGRGDTAVGEMLTMPKWTPQEIIVNERVRGDEVTKRVLERCPGVPVRWVRSARGKDVVAASKILSQAKGGMLDTVLAGKRVLFITSPGQAVDTFEMPDDRMVCPHFARLKLAANGCFYRCDWCYLKLTYRAAFPFISIPVDYQRIIKQLERRLSREAGPLMFNSGEMADSLALDHLTDASRTFVPWFAKSEKGRLFMLTKSDTVDNLLDLEHNGHTVVAWSMNAPSVSRRFELGAPSFERRLAAAARVQAAGYPVRVRLDPIVPGEGWREEYAETIARIFEVLSPERITLGTLRFEPGFWRMRQTIMATGAALLEHMDRMAPMFGPRKIGGKTKVGKYSYPEEERAEVFGFAIEEIRRHSGCTIALCKESAPVWEAVGLPLSRCACVCQLNAVDRTMG